MKRLYFALTILVVAFGLLGTFARALPKGPLNYQNVQDENGANLRYRKLDKGYLLVLVPGQEIIQSLNRFQKAMGFKLATASAIGDVEKVRLGHFNSRTRQMDLANEITESNEMTSLNCSLATLVRADSIAAVLFAHCHINLGLASAQGNQVVGGHLLSATVSVVAEIFILTFPEEVIKTHDEPYNGNLFDLNFLDVVKGI